MFYRHEWVVKEEFPDEAEVSLEEIEKAVSLVLYTGHPLIDSIRPVAPNFQYIGFIQCRPPKPLPEHLEKYMHSGAEHGVIYVSFGSFYQESDLSTESLSTMLSVFGRLKQKVLFKWKGNMPVEVPNNVMLSAWFPQQDILGHNNTRLFITHGGRASVQEAIYHEVPMVTPIVIPNVCFYLPLR